MDLQDYWRNWQGMLLNNLCSNGRMDNTAFQERQQQAGCWYLGSYRTHNALNANTVGRREYKYIRKKLLGQIFSHDRIFKFLYLSLKFRDSQGYTARSSKWLNKCGSLAGTFDQGYRWGSQINISFIKGHCESGNERSKENTPVETKVFKSR